MFIIFILIEIISKGYLQALVSTKFKILIQKNSQKSLISTLSSNTQCGVAMLWAKQVFENISNNVHLHVALLCLPWEASVQLLVLSFSVTFLGMVHLFAALLISSGQFQTENLKSRMFGDAVEHKNSITCLGCLLSQGGLR